MDEDVIQANEAFYRAFESLDIEQMSAIWDADISIRCVHPGWSALTDWSTVMSSWERIFENAGMMQFTITDSAVTVCGEWAWVACKENLSSLQGGRVVSGAVETLNIFRRRGQAWKLVIHHGSPIA